MISAITNPFLYSYFNETFKTGLQRIFSSCLHINQMKFDQTEDFVRKIKLERNSSQIRTSDYRPSSIRTSYNPSTRLTAISSNQFSSSISSET